MKFSFSPVYVYCSLFIIFLFKFFLVWVCVVVISSRALHVCLGRLGYIILRV